MYNLEFKADASIEMQEAYEWYEIQLAGLGERFFETLDNYFKSICISPEQFKVVYKKKRAVYFQDFPYQIIFSIYKDTVVVFSIFHSKRNPKIWKKR